MPRVDASNRDIVSVGAVTVDMPISESWRATTVSDEAADDSDKTFTVPASTEWQILWLRVELTTTADVGNRQLAVQVLDAADDVVGEVRAGTTQAASLTYNYMFGASLADLTAVRDSTWLMTPLPAGLILPAGYKLRVYDNVAIAAAADDMQVHLGYAYRSV